MKTTFFLAIFFGFVGVLAAGHFVPWGAHVRLASQTHVVANGGRAEQFVIRLPADRIDVAGAKTSGVRAAAGAGELPAQLTSEPLLVEHFKVRDAAGNVIGLAALQCRAALDTALRSAGYNAGTAWNGDVKVAFAPEGADAAIVAAGSDEFAGLAGKYSETWTITGVTDGGELHGTIEIDTVTRHGS